MFNLTIAENVVAKLKPYFSSDFKVLFDLVDGTGQFADAAASCSLDTAFRLIFVDATVSTPEYTISVHTNLGDVYAKTGTEYAMSKNMRLAYVGPFNQLTLSGEDGVIDPNIEIKNKVSSPIK